MNLKFGGAEPEDLLARLLGLPGLPHVELRADPGPRGRLGGYPQRVHDVGLADGHL